MVISNTIIYSDNLNETEFLRLLAKRGIKTIGVRVLNSYDLALYALTKLGKTKKGKYLNNEEQDFIYFNLCQPQCFNDSSNIRSAVNTFRDTGNGNTYKELEPFLNKCFNEKKKEIEKAFTLYENYKNNEGVYDLYDLLYELDKQPTKINSTVIYFDDLPFSSLGISLFSKYFDLKAEKFAHFLAKEEKPHIEAYKCFGKNNEFTNFIDKINNKIPFDECLVVLNNPADIVELITKLEQYNIPYTSSLGIPFAQTDVGKFLNKLRYMKNKEWGIEAYTQLFSAPFFNANKYVSNLSTDKEKNYFIKYLGWLRPSFDKNPISVDPSLYPTKKGLVLQAVQSVCDEINNQHKMFDFIKDNLVNAANNFEAIKALDKYQDYMDQYGVSFDIVADNLLGSSISQHISKEGTVHICSLSQAFSSLRKNIFVLGLDSSFPGNPKENYLLFDEELRMMSAYRYISNALVKEKKDMMKLLINSSYNCYLSYSYYNVIDNKNINPSSIIQELNISPTEFSYEDDVLSANNKIISDYNKGIVSLPDNTHTAYQYDPSLILSKDYKPSEFNKYFIEEYKLGFILNSIFDISIAEEDDPYVVIGASDKGNLFHSVVENFDKSTVSEQDLVDNGLKLFDEFIATKPPIVNAEAIKTRNNFKQGLINFYQEDPGNIHVLSEKSIPSCNVYGLNFAGRFDRIEQEKGSNKYILVDYKTSESSNKHANNDVILCMQGLIYAEMIEKTLKIKIDRCVFRYPFIKSESYILFNKANRDALKTLIQQFIDDVKNGTIESHGKVDKYVDQYGGLISLIKEIKR